MSDVRGVQVHESPLAFEATTERLRSVITERGLRLFDLIDHRQAAADVGMELRPTRVLVFGSPKAGTPLMAQSPLLALELPVRILVWEGDDGVTRAAHWTAESLGAQFGLDPGALGPLGAPGAIVAPAFDGG